MAAFSDKNIRGFDIAMNDALGMSGIERVGNLNCQTEQNIRLDGLSADQMLERFAIQKLHGDECLSVLLADVVNGANIRMIQRGCGLRFALETGKSLRVASNFLRQEFERDEAMKPGVFRFVNDAHPAAAQFFDDAVVGNRASNEWGRIGHPRKSYAARERKSICLANVRQSVSDIGLVSGAESPHAAADWGHATSLSPPAR